MPGTSAIGGLISGLDTSTIVDQLIAVSRRRIDVVVNEQSKQDTKLTSFQSLNTQLADFQSQAESLKDSDTFNVFKTSSSTTSTSYSSDQLVTSSVTETAVPGTHTVSFTASSQLAQARQLSSASYNSSSTALNISGDFIINGKVISVTTSDTLADIVSTINTANSGSNATRVTATLIAVSDTDNRIILTSDKTGENEFSILDASSGNILQTLGLTDNSTPTIKNATSDGAESDKFSSSDTAVGSLLGLSSAQSSSSVQIAGTSISIDLSSDSLTDIATTINAVSGVSASVASTTTDGVTTYHIDISGTTSFTDNNNILQTLGIIEGSQSSVAEVHTASIANTKTTAAGGGSVDSSTKFSEINTGSDSNNVTNSDTITLSGTTHDGTAVTGTYTISDKTTDTIDDLLTQIETTFGLGASSATISDGKIVITDDTAGDSQLSIKIITNNQGGGTLDFGTVEVTTQGYQMQTTAGQDAKVTINGVAVTRSSNTIDDVISGVTLNITRIDAGESVNLTISRDTEKIQSSINNFTKSYNSIIEFINQEFTYNEDTKSSGVLAGESTLSTIKSIIQSTIASSINLLPSGSNAFSLIGITSDINGKLSLNSSVFSSKINSDFNAVKRIFIAEGTTTNNEITYLRHSKDTLAGEYDITINTVATQASKTGTVDLTSGIGSGNTETLTITDTSSGRVATITLDGDSSQNGSSIDNIVNAINSELATERIQTIVGDVANSKTTSSGGGVISSSTKFNEINTGGDANDLSNSDVITFTGTSRTGAGISGTYTISDVSTDTVQGLLTTIEAAYGNTVSATINTSGKIVLTDENTGDSSLSISITEPGSLDFGTVLTSNTGGITGRYSMEITASDDGNGYLVLSHNNYGSSYGLITVETNDRLGTEGTYTGVDVAGTINGESASGTGQLLIGDAPPDSSSTTSIEDLAIKVTSTATGSKGSVKLTLGVAELMYNNMITITDQVDGLLTIRTKGLQDTIDNMQVNILEMEKRLVNEEARLNYQFTQLELNLSRLQSVSSFMAQQLNQLSK